MKLSPLFEWQVSIFQAPKTLSGEWTGGVSPPDSRSRFAEVSPRGLSLLHHRAYGSVHGGSAELTADRFVEREESDTFEVGI